MADRPTEVEFRVPGMPIAQPRHRASCRGGFARLYLPKDHPVHEWKKAIETCAGQCVRRTGALEGPLRLECAFNFAAPKRSAIGDYRRAKPDIDNLLKAVMDALTDAGMWEDDSQVACLHATKVQAESAFVVIRVTSLHFKVE